MLVLPLMLLPCVPALSTLTITVVPSVRSRRKTSPALLVSPATRLLATEVNATKRPSSLMAASKLPLVAWASLLSTLTRSVVPA